MDIQKLKIERGDMVILTYDEDLDIDAINTHYEVMEKALGEVYGCIVVANRTDFIKNITVMKNESEAFPFR